MSHAAAPSFRACNSRHQLNIISWLRSVDADLLQFARELGVLGGGGGVKVEPVEECQVHDIYIYQAQTGQFPRLNSKK